MNLKTELLPHQLDAVEKLIKLKVGALLMEQGTGKSLTVIEIARRRLERNKIDHIIWLCPCTAKKNIAAEIKRHCPDEMLDKFSICGIETLSTSVRAISYLLQLSTEKKCFLVVDESLFVKNFFAKRTRHIELIAKQCEYRMILNGTPISKNVADLFAQFYLLDWRILGYKSYYTFAAHHIEYKDGRIKKVLDVDSIIQKISPYSFKKKRSECIELPPKKYGTFYFALTSDQQKHYEEVADTLLMQVDELKNDTIYRLFAGLRAVMSGKRVNFVNENHFETTEFFVDPMDNPRIARLMGLIQWNSSKTIIYCEYESEISQLCTLLGNAAVRYDGKIKLKERNRNLEAFMRDPDKLYLIANPQCAGYSLNLQFCSRIIYMSNNWNLGTRLQSEDRVHRIGQTEQVEIWDVCCDNTLDEKILSCLERKESLLDDIKQYISNKSSLQEWLKSKKKGETNNVENLFAEDSVSGDTGTA